MAEKLLQKLEEKMMFLISEIEGLRQEVQRLRHENMSFKQAKEQDEKEQAQQVQRIAEMIQMIDTVNVVEINPNAANLMAGAKPVLLEEAVQSAG